MATLTDVRRWDPAALERAAADLGARVATMTALQDEIDTIRAVPGWEGAAADAAARTGQGLLDRLEGAVAGAVAVRSATSQAAVAVADLRRRLQAVDDRAHEAGLVLAPDGTITAPPTPAEPPPIPATGPSEVAPPDAARQQVADELHRQLGTIMADASALDAAYRAALDAAARDEFSPDRAPGSRPDTLEGAARFGSINAALEPAPTPPAANASPEAIAEWFNRLPPIQREQAQNDPRAWALLGATPTIPAAVRERVHRASNAAAFHAITGTDPVSANDWRTAAMKRPGFSGG